MAARIVKEELTAEYLRELLSYNPETGEFVWRVSCRGTKAGDIAGTSGSQGRRHIIIGYARYKAHRLAWLYVYGKWPEKLIDHINGVRSDNRIENLRAATKSINKINESLRSNSQSGFIGVSWHTPTDSRKTSKWVAKIALAGKHHHIGYFHDLKLAVLAYNAECERLHGEYGKRKIDHNLNKLREMGLL